MTSEVSNSLHNTSGNDLTAKHTPGPWKYEQGSDRTDFIVTEPSGRTICEPNDPLFAGDIKSHRLRYIGVSEAQANAHLIAAAPELLEAARLAHEFITRIANTMPVAANGESLTLIKLSIAIAKAEGRQP